MIEETYGACQLDGLLVDQYKRLKEARAQAAYWRSEAANAQEHLETAMGAATTATINGSTVISFGYVTDEFGNTHRVFKVVE